MPNAPTSTAVTNAAASILKTTKFGAHLLRGRLWIESLIALALGMALMRMVYGDGKDLSNKVTGVPGNDSFFHIKMAAMIPEGGLLDELPWLRFSWFRREGDAYVSNHYGFHVLLCPFVYASHALRDDYLAGGRWAMAVCMGLSLVLLNLLLLERGVPWRVYWLIVFVLLPFQFFVRHAYVRAIAPSLVVMLLLILLMFRRRYAWAGLTVLAFTHLYNGGLIYGPVLVILFVAASLIGSREERKGLWRLIVCTLGGWALGILIHPYRAGLFEFMRMQVFGTGLTPDISVGTEWRPYDNVWWFAQMSGVLLTVWAVALCLRLRLGPRLQAPDLMLTLANFFFLALTFKARRFIEYWPVFCLLSAACLSSAPIAQFKIRLTNVFQRNQWRRFVAATAYVFAVPVILLIVFGLVRFSTLWMLIRKDARCKYDLPAIRSAMDFLKEHSERGDVVFADDWDIFPVYFFFNDHNHYVAGLDPKFTHERRPDWWERFVKITRGLAPTEVIVNVPVDGSTASGGFEKKSIHVALEDIRDIFGARYAISDADHKALAGKLAAAPNLAELVYPCTQYSECRDAPYVIFRIRTPA